MKIADTFTCGRPWHYTEGADNLPKIGQVVWVDMGERLERFKFLERPLDERLSECEFRYYFENIDGSIIIAESGVYWKIA